MGEYRDSEKTGHVFNKILYLKIDIKLRCSIGFMKLYSFDCGFYYFHFLTNNIYKYSEFSLKYKEIYFILLLMSISCFLKVKNYLYTFC